MLAASSSSSSSSSSSTFATMAIEVDNERLEFRLKEVLSK